MLTRAQKEEQVAEMREKIGRASSVYVADYCGLDVPGANELRSRIHSEGNGDYEYRVAKISVLSRASADSAAEGLATHFKGPIAVALSYGDPIGLAKILTEFSKAHKVFEIKGGLVDGEIVDASQIAALAELPSLDVLRGQIVGLVQASATKLVRLLVEPGTQLARLVEARRAQQEEGGAS